MRTVETQREISTIQLNVRRAESIIRSFLLTGSSETLHDYERAIAALPPNFERLNTLNQTDQRQLDEGERLRLAVAARIAEFDEAVRAAKQSIALDPARPRQDIPSNGATTVVRDISTKLLGDEAHELQSRLIAAENMQQLAASVTLSGTLLVLLLAGFSISLIRRSLRARDYTAAQLRHSNDDLEIAVAERTADLQEANNEIQRFAYIVSHDLRAPLVNIMGFTTELEHLHNTMIQRFMRLAELERRPSAPGSKASAVLDRSKAISPDQLTEEDKLLSADFTEATGFIRSSVNKMDRLISAILKMTREGGREFNPETIDLRELMENIVRTLAHQASEAEATVTVGKLPSITSDRLSLEQVFSNLLENALKYLNSDRPGQVEIRGDSKPGYVIIEVIDNGRGIDPKDHQRIFDLFRRAGKQDKPGQGIGLAHARALVRKLGGSLTVKSKLDMGSTFTVTLPAEMVRMDAQ